MKRSDRTFHMDLTPNGKSSCVVVDGKDISKLLRGVVVRSSVDEPTSVELQPRLGSGADLQAVLPEARVIIQGDGATAVANRLARWTNHRSTCARVLEAGACDCGLNAALMDLGVSN